VELRLVRSDDKTRGTLEVDGVFFCFTLEPPAGLVNFSRIPAGTYPLKLTVSARAQRGGLWSPDKAKRLPLVDPVPGREGIRIHAGNTVANSQGCILVGWDRKGETLLQSRVALEALMRRIKEPCWLTVEDS
jgi:hypothetical protein